MFKKMCSNVFLIAVEKDVEKYCVLNDPINLLIIDPINLLIIDPINLLIIDPINLLINPL
jgi:hypothetical protein